MSLESGRALGHYQVEGKIGEGGMGEVYRAQDLKLARAVAIKILPQALASDPERLLRFQREAQVLASLNHPNIAAIYGLEEIEGVRFLVLELVEGPELTERLAQGPLPLDETLGIARQIADALEAAHDQGVVHRDLKPANVKLTGQGKVKVLDFGLAKALQTGPAGEVDSSHSPTITSLGTRAGVILGTAAYMSPEQARGSAVDRRADIWAFGCVLLEMLTGDNPFREPTVSDTLASILRSDPDWKNVPDGTPAALRRLLERCLDKDPHRRLRDIGEARVAIDGIVSGAAAADEPARAGPALRPGSGRSAWILAAAVLLSIIGTLSVVRMLEPSSAAPSVRRFEVIHDPFDHSGIVPPEISPDGRKIVFSRDDRLWVRSVDDLEPLKLEGTAGATQPRWTPDSRTILFVTKGDVKSVPAGGGAPTTVAFGIGDISEWGGLACSEDGRIVYSSGNGGIGEVTMREGAAHELYRPDGKTVVDIHQPTLLPDGNVLCIVHRLPQGGDTISVFAEGAQKYVLQLESERLQSPVYSPTGHIVFNREGAKAGLWAVPFSLAKLEVTGEPFLITADGSFPSVSNDGTLLYVRGAAGGMRQLVWVDRDGTVGDAVGPQQAGIAAPALSPDGARVAVMAHTGDAGSIWIYEVASGTRTRLTFPKGTHWDWDPSWTPDGEEIVFWDGTTRALSRRAADGSGDMERLVEMELLDSGVPSLSPDGKTMAFWVKPSAGASDVWVMELDPDAEPRPLLATESAENNPRISPDGRFLAYDSDESGRTEVYLTRFPTGEGKWQVSVDGGHSPVWSPAGGELFFLEGTNVKHVDVTLGTGPRIGTPRTLFDAAASGLEVLSHSRYEASRDGRRFLMVKAVQSEGVEPSVVLHYGWDAALR